MVSIAIQGHCLSSPIGCWKPTHQCIVARMGQISSEASRVLGGPKRAADWLTRPAYGLNWRHPCEVVADPDGYQRVMDYLGRIEYGVY
jgi:putative toxin-antitoxin system antitoxin component (TIGR02293 family)